MIAAGVVGAILRAWEWVHQHVVLAFGVASMTKFKHSIRIAALVAREQGLEEYVAA